MFIVRFADGVGRAAGIYHTVTSRPTDIGGYGTSFWVTQNDDGSGVLTESGTDIGLKLAGSTLGVWIDCALKDEVPPGNIDPVVEPT